MCALSAGGGRWVGYLLPRIWLKCAPFLSLRVPLCGRACHYLQMGRFYAGRTRERCLWCKFMDSSKRKFELFSLLCPSFHRGARSCGEKHPTKHFGLIKSQQTTLWELMIDWTMQPLSGPAAQKCDTLKRIRGFSVSVIKFAFKLWVYNFIHFMLKQ